MLIRTRHALSMWLLFALLTVKALVPAGWMPVVDQGDARIVLCTAQGPVMATLDADGGIHREGAPEASGRDTCPFATFAQPFYLNAPTLLAVLPATQRPPGAAALASALIAARKSLRPPARGPPRFA